MGSKPIGGTTGTGPGLFGAYEQSWYLHLRVEGRSPRTPETHAARLKAFRLWLEAHGGGAQGNAQGGAQGGAAPNSALAGGLDPAAVTRQDVESFLLDSLEVSVSCTNDRFRTLRAWYNFLVADGAVGASPLARLRPPRLSVPPPPVLSTATVAALLKGGQGSGYHDRRDTAIVRLWLDTGLRVSEVAGLTLGTLDMAALQVVVTGKGDGRTSGGKVRVVPFGSKAALALARYLRVRGQNASALTSDALFCGRQGHLTRWSLEAMVHRRGVAIGVPDLHPHLFRHTFAHNWLAGGGSEGDLMRLMGWSSRSMCDRYAASSAVARAVAAHRVMGVGDAY